MDFFQHQQQARTSTRRLIFLFALAVLSLIIMTNLLVMFTFGFLDSEIQRTTGSTTIIDWQLIAGISLVVLAVILIGSIYKMSSLSSGGTAVAEMLGGKLLSQGGVNVDRQKVLNVVEEMAIASGTPVPPVYLLDEAGINAFAAGFTPSDAVIGITQGAIEKLDRDQLQGVIAHEFSHILNGDMRLNIRLIGMLHGILVIGMIGYHMMRSGSHSRKNGAAFAGLGLGLMLIGYAGTFFGNLIKAAVSRQREFLADASAVQFTRNPDGISGALINIGASQYGSNIENPECAEVSHCLFGAGMSHFYSGLFATHPPLEERIKRVKPSWNGIFIASKSKHKEPDEKAKAADRPDKKTMAATAAVILAGAEQLAEVGKPQQAHLQVAIELLASLPVSFAQAVREPYGARAVIYSLLLDENNADIRTRQLSHLEYNADSGIHKQVLDLLTARKELTQQMRLPLIELALPSLRQLSLPQYVLFKSIAERLIELDGRISLFEWVLKQLVFHHLQRVFDKTDTHKKYWSKKQLNAETGLLLSVMSRLDGKDGLTAQQVFDVGGQQLGMPNIGLLAEGDISFQKLEVALGRLVNLVPLDKRDLLTACRACLTADDKVSVKEVELYRVIAEILDCPVPPLVITEF